MAGYIGSKAVLLSTTAAVITGNSTVGGNLTVDTNTLFVDAANNRVGVGTSSPADRLHIIGAIRAGTQSGACVTLSQNENGGEIGLNNSSNAQRGLIDFVDGNNDGNGTLRFLNLSPTDGDVLIGIAAANAAGNIIFLTDNTERARFTGNGYFFFNNTSAFYPGVGNTSTGISFEPTGNGPSVFISRSDNNPFSLNRNTDGAIAAFRRSGVEVGTITVTSSSTSYNTSSDYRLKENVVPLSGAADRLAQIPVHRFNFIAAPDRTVDGFLAHEVQEFVPECVTGEKDQVDDEGNPVYQGIDQSKLVPLLTAALQEALTKINALEARIVTLEGGAA